MANLLSAHRDLGEPRASRRGRRAVGRAPTCRRRRARRRSRCSRRVGRRRDQGAVDRLHEPGAVDARPGDACARALRARRVRRAAGGLRDDRDRARYADLLLPASTWGEKDGTVTNSERRISRVRRAVPRAGRGARRLAHRRATSRAALEPRAARRTRASLFAVRRRRVACGTSTARRRAAATSTSPASATRCSTRDGPQQWPLPEGATEGRARLYEDGVFPTPTAARASSRRRYKAAGRAARRALPVLAQHRPPARPVARHEPHRHAWPRCSATWPSRRSTSRR